MTVTETLDQIHSLVTASELEALSELVAETSSPDIADMLYRLPPVDAAVVYRLLHKDKAIDVFERLDSAAQADLVTERSEEHTSELQSRGHLVCRLLLEKKKR